MRWTAALWWLGAALAGAGGVGIALWRAPQTVTVPTERQAAPPPERPASRPAPMPAPPLLAGVPPGLDAAQWQALQRELAGQPAELRRVVASLAYADTLQRFRATRERALAQQLDEGLDERLQQREMSGNEARLLKQALLDVLLPSDAQRQAALAAWDAAHAPAPRAASARDSEFQRRQAAVVAAWQAQPQRDPQALERQLDALRQAHFGASPGGTPP